MRFRCGLIANAFPCLAQNSISSLIFSTPSVRGSSAVMMVRLEMWADISPIFLRDLSLRPGQPNTVIILELEVGLASNKFSRAIFKENRL